MEISNSLSMLIHELLPWFDGVEEPELRSCDIEDVFFAIVERDLEDFVPVFRVVFCFMRGFEEDVVVGGFDEEGDFVDGCVEIYSVVTSYF